MAALTEMIEDIRASVPEVPSFVAQRQLIRAARLFCEETRAWRTNIALSVLADISTVALGTKVPTYTELVDIISIKNTAGGQPVKPRTFSWLDENMSDWRSESALNAVYYVLEGNNTLRFVPTPSDTTLDLYDVRVAVKPLLTTTTFDDLLVNKHREALIDGALSYLFLVPRKPWTDAGLAQHYLALFRDALPAARVEAADEFQTGVPRKVKYGGL